MVHSGSTINPDLYAFSWIISLVYCPLWFLLVESICFLFTGFPQQLPLPWHPWPPVPGGWRSPKASFPRRRSTTSPQCSEHGPQMRWTGAWRRQWRPLRIKAPWNGWELDHPTDPTDHPNGLVEACQISPPDTPFINLYNYIYTVYDMYYVYNMLQHFFTFCIVYDYYKQLRFVAGKPSKGKETQQASDVGAKELPWNLGQWTTRWCGYIHHKTGDGDRTSTTWNIFMDT